MSLPKTARFPGRVEKRRKSALIRREVNIKRINSTLSTTKLPEEEVAALTVKLERANTDVTALKAKLRVK